MVTITPFVVRTEDLELSAHDLFTEIQANAAQAYGRQQAREMGESIAPRRVHESSDGSVWVLAVDPGPGVELRGWRIWL